MKSVTVTNQDGSTTHFHTLKSFCDTMCIPQSTFCNMVRTNRLRMTKKTMCLENKSITIHIDDADDVTLTFGKYEPLDYNRPHTCQCGVTHYHRDMKRHQRSKFHQNWVSSQNHTI